MGLADFKIHDQLDIGVDQGCFADNFIAMFERKNMFGGCPDNGKNDFLPVIIGVKIDTVVLK